MCCTDHGVFFIARTMVFLHHWSASEVAHQRNDRTLADRNRSKFDLNCRFEQCRTVTRQICLERRRSKSPPSSRSKSLALTVFQSAVGSRDVVASSKQKHSPTCRASAPSNPPIRFKRSMTCHITCSSTVFRMGFEVRFMRCSSLLATVLTAMQRR